MSSSSGSRFVRLFLSQLGFKLISFVLTSLLTRSLIPEAKGVGFFFEMYFLAGGFLSREAVRSLHARLPLFSAASSASSSPNSKTEKQRHRFVSSFLGSGLFCVLVASVLIIPLSLLHANFTMSDELKQAISLLPSFFIKNTQQQQTTTTNTDALVMIISVASTLIVALLLELLGETHWNLSMSLREHGGIEGRATGESWSLLLKTLVTTILVRYFLPVVAASSPSPSASSSASSLSSSDDYQYHQMEIQKAVIGFALGHLTYGIIFFLLSCRELSRSMKVAKEEETPEKKKILDTFIRPSIISSPPSLLLVLAFVKPSFSNLKASILEYSSSAVFFQFIQENLLRLILTEGEKFVVSSVGVVSLSVQGAFDVATSLGKLVTRILFRLWEEFAFNEWSKCAGKIVTLDDENDDDDQKKKKTTSKKEKDERIKSIKDQIISLLHNLCRVAIIVGVLSCCFGPLLSGRILLTLFGTTWANRQAAEILSVFLITLPLFGLNGLIEAFGRALASPDEMKRTRVQLLGVSFAYLTAAFFSLKYFSDGDVKLLIAVNGLQFLMRIFIGLFSARRIIHDRNLDHHDEQQQQQQQRNFISFLRPFFPSWIFTSFCVGVTSFLAVYRNGSDQVTFFNKEMGVYAVSFKQDLIVIGAGVCALVVAVLTEPEAMKKMMQFIARRRRGAGTEEADGEKKKQE